MNFKNAWRLLNARAYIIITDKFAASHIPHLDPYSLDDVLILGAQQAALVDMKIRLDDMIKEHQLRIKQLRRK